MARRRRLGRSDEVPGASIVFPGIPQDHVMAIPTAEHDGDVASLIIGHGMVVSASRPQGHADEMPVPIILPGVVEANASRAIAPEENGYSPGRIKGHGVRIPFRRRQGGGDFGPRCAVVFPGVAEVASASQAAEEDRPLAERIVSHPLVDVGPARGRLGRQG